MCIYYILIINSECIPIGCNWKFYKVGSGVWAFCEVLGSPPFNYHRFKSMDDVTSAESATAIIRTIFGGLLGLIDAKTARLLQGLKLNFRPVGFRQLIGNVPEHLFHSFPRFT